ncbi:hypothetical protein F7725_021297 [Dissostichus mawsoni]|uniref:G-protein coupled receptors family 1 profile domain-containing protein n=1 Tax=Dissostichus mawsoni TaxID=36200 RepID=A0A7J5YHM4_DISMA|nr:hypothetical protein F7725_021297 [Dissostichus mawsoni]
MYLFLCSLFVNELCGSTGLFPFLLVQILSDIHTVSAPLCFLQIFSLYTYLCGNIINKVYCDNYSIVKLACSDTTVNNVYGLIVTFLLIISPVFLIFYTYMKILRVCFSGSKQTRQKTFSTCTPHLASLLNVSCGCCFEVIQNRFDMEFVPNMLRIFLSLYYLSFQPIFNPVLYGLNMTKIRIIVPTCLIVVICVSRSLHEPMYLFLCSLFVNELCGSTGLFPSLLVQILSDIHTVSAPFCFLQVFSLYTYANVQFYNLAIMSYDRYLAICHPLHYNTPVWEHH